MKHTLFALPLLIALAAPVTAAADGCNLRQLINNVSLRMQQEPQPLQWTETCTNKDGTTHSVKGIRLDKDTNQDGIKDYAIHINMAFQ